MFFYVVNFFLSGNLQEKYTSIIVSKQFSNLLIETKPLIRLIFVEKTKTMAKQFFTLTEESEFIPLDKLLKFMLLVNSGGEAHMAIQDGLVKVNGDVELQKRKKIRVGDNVQFAGEYIEVTE